HVEAGSLVVAVAQPQPDPRGAQDREPAVDRLRHEPRQRARINGEGEDPRWLRLQEVVVWDTRSRCLPSGRSGPNASPSIFSGNCPSSFKWNEGLSRSRKRDLVTGLVPAGSGGTCGSEGLPLTSVVVAEIVAFQICLKRGGASPGAVPSRSMTRNSLSLIARISLTP